MIVEQSDMMTRDEEIAVRVFEGFLKTWQPSSFGGDRDEDHRFMTELHFLLARHTELQTRRIIKMMMDLAARSPQPFFVAEKVPSG